MNMRLIRKDCDSRKITRLCHFTQSRNLAYLFGGSFGLCSTKKLEMLDIPYNPTDLERKDGHRDMICCSIQYPNPYYFERARQREKLFTDWAILLINRRYLWHPGTKFSPCNGAKNSGMHIKGGILSFRSLYNRMSLMEFSRNIPYHLSSAPTDIQAEVFLKDPVPLKSINGIIFKTTEQAQRETSRLKIQGITFKIPVFIAPSLFEKKRLSIMIRRGIKAEERRHGFV